MNNIFFEDGRTVTPGKIIAVGRNYSEHIKEMHSEKTAEPVLFVKPNNALCQLNEPLEIPKHLGAVHHEIELAVCMEKGGSNMPEDSVEAAIAGYGIALDLTLRDIQSVAKKKGLPWAVAKGFDNACPVSVFTEMSLEQAQNTPLSLIKNGTQMQSGNTRQMIFPIAELVSYISGIFTLEAGDIILTGTPAGVGPLVTGDVIDCSIEGITKVTTRVR